LPAEAAKARSDAFESDRALILQGLSRLFEFAARGRQRAGWSHSEGNQVMQKIVELKIEEAKAVAGGLKIGGHGDFGGDSGFGAGAPGGYNHGGPLPIEKRR
jgi:hypothetical protein